MIKGYELVDYQLISMKFLAMTVSQVHARNKFTINRTLPHLTVGNVTQQFISNLENSQNVPGQQVAFSLQK